MFSWRVVWKCLVFEISVKNRPRFRSQREGADSQFEKPRVCVPRENPHPLCTKFRPVLDLYLENCAFSDYAPRGFFDLSKILRRMIQIIQNLGINELLL